MARFVKTVIPVGTHQSPEGPVVVTPERIRRWADQHAAMRLAGIKTPVPWGHQRNAVPQYEGEQAFLAAKLNAGYFDRLQVAADGQSLLAEIDAPGVDVDNGNLTALAELQNGLKVKSAISEVSAAITKRFTDGKGKVWDDVITHIALTPLPVVAGQDGFQALSLEDGVQQWLAFDPNETRDESGKWKGGGAGVLPAPPEIAENLKLTGRKLVHEFQSGAKTEADISRDKLDEIVREMVGKASPHEVAAAIGYKRKFKSNKDAFKAVADAFAAQIGGSLRAYLSLPTPETIRLSLGAAGWTLATGGNMADKPFPPKDDEDDDDTDDVKVDDPAAEGGTPPPVDAPAAAPPAPAANPQDAQTFFQAKALLAEHGITLPEATTPENGWEHLAVALTALKGKLTPKDSADDPNAQDKPMDRDDPNAPVIAENNPAMLSLQRDNPVMHQILVKQQDKERARVRKSLAKKLDKVRSLIPPPVMAVLDVSPESISLSLTREGELIAPKEFTREDVLNILIAAIPRGAASKLTQTLSHATAHPNPLEKPNSPEAQKRVTDEMAKMVGV